MNYNDKPKCILLIGIPGAGKSTYAKEYIDTHVNTIHLSSDAIRKELYGDESIQGDPSEVFSLMQKRAVEALNNGYDVIYDATNMTRKDRANIISLCPKFVQIEAHIIWAPIETCVERDASRDRTVGKEVIDKMLKRFQAVYYDEGINEIKIVLPQDFKQSNYHHDVLRAMNIPHDNPHHTLNIFDHCMAAFDWIHAQTDDVEMMLAALWHDIGKSYTKAFIDNKGNPCEHAHYYQHQSVGSYLSYGMCNTTPYIAWLISTHMDPYFNTKYYNNLPPFLKRNVDLLHQADLTAH